DPRGPLVLTQAGTYTLYLYGSGANTGTYAFKLLNPALPTTALAFSTPVSGTLANPGDEAIYTFTGTAGQRIDYDALVTNRSLNVLILSPSGSNILNRNAADDGGFSLVEPGTYRVFLYGSGVTTGSFGFQLVNVSAAPAVAFNTVVSGTLTPGLNNHYYQFVGTAGQHVYLQELGTATGGQLELYANGLTPNPQFLHSARLDTDFQATLPSDGTYVLVVR